MKTDRPSQTAHLVALGRATADAGVSHVPNFRDPTARVFLNAKGVRSLAKTEEAARGGVQGFRLEMARVMANMMALRTMAIDAAVRDAIASGAKQLVILGAGYDGRAWRMSELAGIKVFEVDHPATQGSKRSVVDALPAAIGDVSFVPMNFEHGSLDDALHRAGHDRSSCTCWIWEGVVMYLTRAAMRATLNSVGGRSAPDSTLIVNYHTIQRRFLMRLILRLIGEPMISHWSPAEMAADLLSAGFEVVDDTGMSDWNARFAGGAANVQRGSYMRIAVAQRD